MATHGTGIHDIVDVDDLAAATDDAAVMTHGDRVILSLDPHAAAALARAIARHDAIDFVYHHDEVLGDDWVPVLVQLLVAAAHLREPKPASTFLPIVGAAS